MEYKLTNQNRIDIINDHLEALTRTKYSCEILLEQENILDPKDDEKINSINIEIANIIKKQTFLQNKLNELEA